VKNVALKMPLVSIYGCLYIAANLGGPVMRPIAIRVFIL
jgi:hypothetical protein